MAVLYRKYRPQAFGEAVGQQAIIRTLKNQIAGGTVAHAYLFTGSRGVGKTTLARILAKAVNCLKPKDGEPCGKCDVCQSVANGNFLDLVEIDAASNTGVDNIRDLIEHVKFSPTSGKFKVFIIDEVHMLSKGAFNALLKTLEEPPRHTIFVLATTEINKVPATIISRTQRFDFRRISVSELQSYLEEVLKKEKIKLSSEVVKLVAEGSEGSARDALSLLGKVLTLGEDITAEECEALLGITNFSLSNDLLAMVLAGQMEKIPDFFDNLVERGADFQVFNRDFLEFLRKVLIFKITKTAPAGISKEHSKLILEQAERCSVSELVFDIRLFLRSYKEMSFSPREDVPLLLAALEAAQKRSGGTAGKKPGGAAAKDIPEDTAGVVKPSAGSSDTSSFQVQVESTSQSSAESPSLSMEEVRGWWNKFIAALKKVNSPLANLIRTASLEATAGNAVVLGVKFPFHKQSIENQKNQGVIREVLEDISGQKLVVRASVIKSDSEAAASPASLGEALAVFGGEIIQ